jgi:uroporphyrinogen decarboxylase
VFSPGGGFVFAAIHNIVAKVPVENIVAMFDAIAEFRSKGYIANSPEFK